jgi:hypothetical protein
MPKIDRRIAVIENVTEATVNPGDDANQAIRVNVVAGSAAGVSHTDDAAFTPGSDDVVPMGAMLDDAATDTVNEGDVGVVRMGADRILYTKIHDGTLSATVRDTGASDSLNVAITDASGNQIVSFGGGTQYTEGDTDSTITGTAVMFESNTGTNTLSVVNATTPLPVNTELPTAVTLDDAVADGITAPVIGNVLYLYDAGTPDYNRIRSANNLADGAAGGTMMPVVMVGYNGATFDRLRTDTTNGLDVDVTRVIPGTTATALGKAEDAGHSTGDTGVMSLAVRNDAGTALAGTDLDYTPITTNSAGHVWVTQSAVTPGTAATNLGKAEDAAHTSGDVGVMALAVRQDTQSALAGTTADYIPLTTDANGSARVVAAGYSKIISSTLTRPNNTTAYTAGDEVSNSDSAPTIITLTGMARFTGGTGAILGVSCSISSNWATKPILDLFIYDTTSTPQNDNSAFAPSDGEQDTVITVIPLAASYVGTSTANTGNFVMDTGPISIPFETVGSANLYLRVAIRNAGQAGAGQDTLKFRFRVLQD